MMYSKVNNIGLTVLKVILAMGFFFLIASGGLFAAEDNFTATRRFGIFIGSNNGGRDRVMLRYAVSDARSVSRVFGSMGGITGEDNILLVEPTIGEINRQLDNLGRLSAQARRNSQRTELVFYYSGHSNEEGILLNRESYGYRELRERINSVQAEMRIVILDSCSSGAITRAKGGVKTQPFLFDSSVSAEGYAFLTSSSADEASQESDAIESSYFTHSLLAGLRGAADSVGDGRVTLNELYRFAYAETLAKTETSVYGAQHPSYDIQISGTGDVVLTDIKEISASLLFSEELTGRISIRDSSDFLVAELTKVTRKPIELGLEPGLYCITLQQGDNFYRVEITLPENQRTTLSMTNFSLIASASGDRRRGAENNGDAPFYPLNIQPIPGLDVMGHGREKATNNLLLGLFVGLGHNIRGIGTAPLGIVNTGYVQGIQASALYNSAGGDVTGIQASGVFNRAGGNVTGVQASGVFNLANGTVLGVQSSGIFNKAGELKGMQAGIVNINGENGNGAMFGIVNVSESENMVPFGLVNVIKNGIFHGAVYVDDMLFTNISFRSGSKWFYTFLSTGVGQTFFSHDGDRLVTGRAGVGFEIPINKFFIDIDVSSGTLVNVDALIDTFRDKPRGKWYDNADESTTGIAQLRLTAGYKVFGHLGIFGGFSYDYLYKNRDTSPDAGDFRDPLIGVVYGRHTHRLGFFGGSQF